MSDAQKLIAHVIHRLDFGGLENGLVNLVNRIPQEKYHHVIICLTDYTEFSKRISNPNVSLYALHKDEGKSPVIYYRLYKLFRKLNPDIVHTRNLSALEASVVAALAGVKGRVHGEHGRDSYDIDGTNTRYLLLRKACKLFVNRYIPLSKDLEGWLKTLVHVPPPKIRQIYNGVDSDKFYPIDAKPVSFPLEIASDVDSFVVGTVGRIQEVKDQLTLVKAVALLVSKNKEYRKAVRLIIVGDGPMMQELSNLVENLGVKEITWITGSRNDIPELLQSMDLFVLPSKAEGISNTILEAMACGLPVLATNVGGNEELVVQGDTGELVPPENPQAMMKAIEGYLLNKDQRLAHGKAGRQRVEKMFSMDSMVGSYLSVYNELIS
ncbi:MAG: TIGR03088 family PEP-CTERM/XrtA system glycosyltransferase [Sedimenticola sp.]